MSEINFDGLTLENFSERTGHRYRMTKAQKNRGLTREAAFQEWLSAATATAKTTQGA